MVLISFNIFSPHKSSFFHFVSVFTRILKKSTSNPPKESQRRLKWSFQDRDSRQFWNISEKITPGCRDSRQPNRLGSNDFRVQPTQSLTPPWKLFDPYLGLKVRVLHFLADFHSSALVLTASPAIPYDGFVGSSASVTDRFKPLEDFSFDFLPTWIVWDQFTTFHWPPGSHSKQPKQLKYRSFPTSHHPAEVPREAAGIEQKHPEKAHNLTTPSNHSYCEGFEWLYCPRQPCPSPSSFETAQMHPFWSQSFSKLNIFASPTPLRQKTTFPLAPTWDSHCWRQQTDQEPPWSTMSAKLIIMITLSVKNCRN